ncbi:T9SS type A sorting domain-containing protein [Aequorivita viscosa]|uniref:Por secretion system C-terminal sorting domain-containing protein n=1 Tax=Aequorivita viscosa TaxID=797419 RepID=A0A1M6C6U8_9FLAO|nr:T9SS type A sorting domain-containing protein [Aequorivita viscosa]SDW24466.1 Por secretion system C-terminal sorting domain-containing protein [Aequorivita viscosa]SHI56725.1 Por secretion system C-terminal sorting domain-containing protein [Aequorivita viscosa]
MKKNLLVCLAVAFSVSGFTQNVDKEYSLREYRSSDYLEYEKYTYNSDLLLTSTDNLLIDDAIRVRDSLTYDANNNVVKLDGYQLLNGNWTHVYYMDYTYDDNGNILSRSNYNSFSGPTFSLGGTYLYFYEDNKLTNWEMYMNGTELFEQCTISYNDNNQVVEEFVQDTWGSGTMEDSWKIEYIYNPDGTLQTSKPSIWNGSSWDYPGAEWFYYDADKNCIKWEHKSGDRVTNRREYEYNMDYTVDQLVFPVTPEDRSETKRLVEMQNMVVLQHWYTENDQGNLIYICDYIYDYDFIGSMGISDHGMRMDSMRMYPNPASDLITVSSENNIISDINILDTTGKVVYKQSNLNKKKANLDVSTLQLGVYYIRSATSKGIVTQKLIVN